MKIFKKISNHIIKTFLFFFILMLKLYILCKMTYKTTHKNISWKLLGLKKDAGEQIIKNNKFFFKFNFKWICMYDIIGKNEKKHNKIFN